MSETPKDRTTKTEVKQRRRKEHGEKKRNTGERG